MLPKHPIPMRTRFRDCFLVNYGVNPEILSPYVPRSIEPILYDGEAYISIVISRMEKMRPAFLPEFLGITYNQVVYRLVVQYAGERGVYFLRSDADNLFMCLVGNWLTYFKFHHSFMDFTKNDKEIGFSLTCAKSETANIQALYDLGLADSRMPISSKFESLDEAKQFLVELYTAFGWDETHEQVHNVRIKRGEWNILVVPDKCARYEFMQSDKYLDAKNCRLDSIFYARSIPYYWYTLDHRP